MAEPAEWQRPSRLAFLDRTNLTVTGLTACFVLFTRSAGVAYFSAGAVICSMTVKQIKRAIRQPRPAHPSQRKISYGMPSTHSATITYFATYVPLACIYLPLHHSLPTTRWVSRILPPLIVLPWAALIAVSRIWLGHHTWPQVAVGCSYGVVFAALWFVLWTNGINEFGSILEQSLDSYFGWR